MSARGLAGMAAVAGLVLAGCGSSGSSSQNGSAAKPTTPFERQVAACQAKRKPNFGRPPAGYSYAPYTAPTKLTPAQQRQITRRFILRGGRNAGVLLSGKAAPVYMLTGYERVARRASKVHEGRARVGGQSWTLVTFRPHGVLVTALFTRIGCFSFGIAGPGDVARKVAAAIARAN